ncbi:hypothetical protein D3C80_2142180 [compost metagenome]
MASIWSMALRLAEKFCSAWVRSLAALMVMLRTAAMAWTMPIASPASLSALMLAFQSSIHSARVFWLSCWPAIACRAR